MRQGAQKFGVNDHYPGLVKGAQEVFPFGQVDGGLAPDGGVHHGQQGGGHLDEGQPPHPDGGQKAGEVPHYAPAQRHDE